MSDYSAVAPPQNFSQSSAFAAALQRAKQIAAKINPNLSSETGTKRPLEEGSDSESKKVATDPVARPSAVTTNNTNSSGSSGGGSSSSSSSSAAAAQAAAQAAAVAARVAAAAAAGLQGLGVPGVALGPVTNEDIKVPDKMVGLSTPINVQSSLEGSNDDALLLLQQDYNKIIGRGGEQISRLQSESGCKIQMAPDSGGLPDRLCTLTGNAQAISRAKDLISSIVQQRSRTEGPGGRMDDMGMSGGGGGSNSSGGGVGGGGPGNMSHFSSNNYQVEIMVPGPKVGLIIGKGGETIKQLQEKSGAKMVVIQEGPSQENEKPLRISGDPQKVEHAKALVYELIAEKEIQRRDSESGRGRGNARGGFDGRMGGGPGGRDFQDRGGGGGGRGWDNGRNGGDKSESTFVVPAAKCGVIIGRGGETIKQINQQTGAHCELDRRSPANSAEKTFVIRGSPEQIEQAKRLIAEKLGMVAGGPNQGGPGGPQNQYQGPMGGGPQQHYAPQGGWSGPPGYQQPWQSQGHPGVDPNQGNPVPLNPQTGQPDYSNQWVEYYRSLGMHREADLIEQNAKANKGMTQPQQPTAGQGPAQQPQPQAGAQQVAVGAAQNGQPDYSAQWADYYRSMGKIKEAEAIENSLKQKQAVAAVTGVAAGGPAGAQPGAAGPQPGGVNPYPQPQYGYQAGGFYTGAPSGPQPGQPTPQPTAQQYAAYPNYAAYSAQPDNQ